MLSDERQLRSVTAAAPTGAGGEVEHGASSKTGFANPGHPHRRLSQQNLPISDICSAANCSLFDHLVGAAEQREWHREPKRLGGLQVEDQFDLGELLHRQRGGILALENATDIDADLAI